MYQLGASSTTEDSLGPGMEFVGQKEAAMCSHATASSLVRNQGCAKGQRTGGEIHEEKQERMKKKLQISLKVSLAIFPLDIHGWQVIRHRRSRQSW